MRLRAGAPNTLGIAGGGVAAEDIDGDGYPDLFFAGAGGGRLYRNVQGKYFQDVTQEVGLNLNGESRAAYFIDYDNDGDQDLFITFVDVSNRLFEQRRGVFVDVTKKVGLDTRGLITHEAVFFDMDRDGLLDLYTAQFGAWHEGLGPTFGRSNNNGLPNRLYKHTFRQGKHRFENKARAAGVADTGWTHCVGVLDYDQDGYPDLFSLNDFGVSRVYHNLGDGRFEDASTAMHFDTSYHAMNFTLLDVNQDGYFEFYVSEITNLMHRQRYRRPTQNTAIVFTKENLANLRILVNNKLYQRTGKGHFEDVHGRIFEPASLGWAWGVSAFDYENDGDPDLLILNGTESEEVLQFETLLSQFSGTQNVFYMSEEGYFYDVSERAPLAFSGDSRSSAVFDFDLDGDLDVVINNYGRPAQIFRNEQQSANRWIRLRLRGASSNQDAIGARVQLTAGDRVQHGVVVAGSGFLSQDPKLLHFGLGRWQGLVDIRVVWPSGQVQHFKNRTPNRMHTLVELQ